MGLSEIFAVGAGWTGPLTNIWTCASCSGKETNLRNIGQTFKSLTTQREITSVHFIGFIFGWGEGEKSPKKKKSANISFSLTAARPSHHHNSSLLRECHSLTESAPFAVARGGGKLFDWWGTMGSKIRKWGPEQQQMNGLFWWATSSEGNECIMGYAQNRCFIVNGKWTKAKLKQNQCLWSSRCLALC